MRALLLTSCLLVLPAAAATSDSVHYRRCMAAQPAAAFADAEGWIKAGGGVPAQHCAAHALVGLNRFAEAGARLDKIAGGRDVPDAAFRAELFDQAGNAWLLAGDGAKAVQSFSGALALSGGDADLFADLARAQAMRRNWPEVVLDLNAALQLRRDPELLVLRASAHRALKQYKEADADLDLALKIKPGDGNALLERGLLRKELGDIGGARRDFQAALKTNVGKAAKDNLDVLKP